MKMSAEGEENTYFIDSLAQMYLHGHGCEKNGEEAIKWFIKYEEGTRGKPEHADALVLLGDMYRDGDGCEIDFVKAFGYYIRASDMGDQTP
jgi:TPR repeat protein